MPPSVVLAASAAIEIDVAASLSRTSTVSAPSGIAAVPAKTDALLRVTTIDSMPSSIPSSTAETVNASVDPTKLESKVSVEPDRVTPSVTSATVCSAASSAGE